MLRITRRILDHESELITLEGKLIGPWVEELRQVAGSTSRLRKIDVSSLSFADADGLQLLRDILQEGAELTDGTSFVSSLLTQVLP